MRPGPTAILCGRGWRCRQGRHAGAAAAVDPRWPAGQLELLVLAMEPVAAGGAGLCGVAAGSGLSTGYGQDFIQRGWGAWGVAPYTDLMAATDAACAHPGSTRRARPRWAARSADTWRTGLPDTPIGSTRSSPTRACGRSTSSAPTTDGAYYWLREMTRDMAAAELAAPVRRPDPHTDAGHPRRQGLSRADRRGAAALVRTADRVGLPAAEDGTSRTSSSTSRRRTTGCSPRSTPRSGTRW